jgi:hypothetical protein
MSDIQPEEELPIAFWVKIKNPEQADFPDIRYLSFWENPEKVLEVILIRLQTGLEHLNACGCPHEARIAKIGKDVEEEVAQLQLCPEDQRIRNPNCAHPYGNSSYPFDLEITKLMDGQILEEKTWNMYLKNMRERIFAVDVEARTAAEGRRYSLPVFQQKQQPNVELLRSIGLELTQIVQHQLQSVRSKTPINRETYSPRIPLSDELIAQFSA